MDESANKIMLDPVIILKASHARISELESELLTYRMMCLQQSKQLEIYKEEVKKLKEKEIKED